MRIFGNQTDHFRRRYLEELIRGAEPEPEPQNEQTERMVQWLESIDIPDGLELSAGVTVVDGERFRSTLLDRVGMKGRTGEVARGMVRRLRNRLEDR